MHFRTLAFILLATLAQPATVNVAPGAGTISAAVAANPVGTTFQLQAGTYYDSVTSLKNNDTFNGAPGAIMRGSTALPTGSNTWTQVTINSVQYWTTPGGSPLTSNQSTTQCESVAPGCYLPQDLYFDGKNFLQQTAFPTVSGTWYYDIAGGDGGTVNNVYLLDNPAGHTVALGTSYYAFQSANITGITVNGPLIIEEYAPDLQYGAIQCGTGNTGWSIIGTASGYVETRYNHGAGIGGSPGCSGLNVTYNYTHHNGEFGWTFGAVTNPNVVNSVCSWNNADDVNIGFGAGCMKITGTGGLFSNNTVTNNHGIGYWTDVNGTNTIYQQSLVANNDGEGGRCEISSGCSFLSSIYSGNGNGTSLESGQSGPQIDSASSSQVTIRGNWFVVANSSGLTGSGSRLQYNSARGGCGTGCTIPQGMSVDHNYFTLLGTSAQPSRLEDDSSPSTFTSWIANDLYDYNTYCVASTPWSSSNWLYNGTATAFTTWQSTNNQDQHSSLQVASLCTPTTIYGATLNGATLH